MNNTHLDQAREWARDNIAGGYFHGGDRALAAAEVIQSLPDTVVDGDKLRELVEKADEGFYSAGSFLRRVKELLPAPPLQTLAELIEAGDKPEDYQWMQAQAFPTATTLGIITGVDGYTRSAIVLFADGMAKNVPWAFITPLPDLPKLEWPGNHADTITAESVEDAPAVDDEPVMLPRPEDVPEGEPWLVLSEGRRAIGYRNDPGASLPWVITYQGCMEFDYCYDSDITLVSRLVPEVKP